MKKPILLILSILAFGVEPLFAQERVFMGEQSCRECHHDAMGRNQFNLWRLSRHAEAYASLGMPEAKEIARLSGIDVDPFESPICLGCHTTAYDSEAWQRDANFHYENGIQCEACHGAGSRYLYTHVEASPDQSREMGLEMPGERFCMICHKEKGSHVAVLGSPQFDFAEALPEIMHSGRGGPMSETDEVDVKPLDGPNYTGALACAECHLSHESDCSYVFWRKTPHADAYALLGSQKAFVIAKQEGVDGNPQEAAACLRCHATGHGEPAGRFLESFDIGEGVQCEACHGAGSDYSPEAVMRDPVAAHQAGLMTVDEDTCRRCHLPGGNHGIAFDLEAAWSAIRPNEAQTQIGEAVEYKTPWNLAVSTDGQRLYIACEASDSLMVLDASSGEIIEEVAIENQPHGVCLSPDGSRIYVSNRGSDSVSEIDATSLSVLRTLPTGDEPHGLLVDADAKTLYAVNTGSYDISVIDLASGEEIRRLSAARGAWAIAQTPDAKTALVSNNLPHFGEFRESSLSEISIVDLRRGTIKDRLMVPDANLLQGIDVSPDGEIALCTLIRTKNLIPMTRVIQGWVMNNGFGVIWLNEGRVDQLLIDEPEAFFADPTDVVFRPDGRFAYLTGGGVNEVAVIDIEAMKTLLKSSSERERTERLPNHLGVSADYIVKRIKVGRSPRGLAASPDGRFIYVADGLDDAVSVIDAQRNERIKTFDLDGPDEITLAREGQRIFHNARVTYGRQFSCHSCHPDGGIDGITYDIEPDGIGVQPVDNRTLRGILDTAPFKWEGTNPSLRRQCGARLAVFFTRIDPFTPEQSNALDRYICTIPRPPNRFRPGDELTPAQQRGREMFYRERDNLGNVIPPEDRCSTCHPPPYYTNREVFDVGTGSPLDHVSDFDVPHLNNIYETAPYLHDGRAPTLEEIWTVYNPYDQHGVTNDMTKDQLNDLVEFLKTL